MRIIVLGLAVLVASLAVPLDKTNAATGDENVAQQIANYLKESGRLKGYRVGVKYEDGVAWLRGTVTSSQQKAIAEQIAGNSPNVEHVINKLEIVPANAGAEVPSSYEARQQLAQSPIKQASQTAVRQASPAVARQAQAPSNNMPVPYAYTGQGQNVRPASYAQQAQYCPDGACMGGEGYLPGGSGGALSYDNPQMPGYAWPSYAASPNYAALTYPQQYSASAWPYIGPFYPYPQVPLGWRKVTLEWDDGWWFLDFKDCKHCK